MNTALASGENWLAGWTNRIILTIDHTKIASPLSNFPVLLHISTSSGIGLNDVSFVFNELNGNSKKIALTTSDGKTECYTEIEKWDVANKQAYLWVRVPSISNTLDTDLYLYYDKNHVDNNLMVGDTGSTPAQNVWDSNFVAVWHLAEIGNGTTGEYKDSTIHAHNGTGGAGVSSRTPTRVDTPTGYGQKFDGIDDYIEIPDHDDFSVDTTKDLTVSWSISPAVLNMDSSGRQQIRYMGKGGVADNLEWVCVLFNADSPDEPQYTKFYNFSPGGTYGAGSWEDGAIPVNTWVRLTGVSHQNSPTDGTVTIWRNGLYNKLICPYTAYSIDYANGTAPVRIGNWYGYPHNSDWFNGTIDEVRISNISRSLEWERASTYSENDNLLTFGVLNGQVPEVITGAASGITTNGATLNANFTGTDSNVTVSFEYGLTTSYGNTAAGIPPTMSSPGDFTAPITGLTSNTLYHYRAVAVGDSTANGNDRTFTTLATNNPPVLNTIGDKSVDEGQALTFTISATDPDGDSLTYSASNLPSWATFTPATRTFSWTPSSGQAGTYNNVSFQVSDGSLTDSEDITITVSGANNPPVAVNNTYTTNEDTALNRAAPGVLSNDTDADGDNLTAVKVSDPAHGALTLNSNGSFTYSPNANYNGTDSFTYRANDGQANSNTATVTITITAVNDTPVAVNDSYTTNEDTALNRAAPGVLSNDTDADGDNLTAVKVSDPAHGTLTLNSNGSFTYTPAANYNGTDSFTYRANDGQANSNTATVTITITAVNDPPVAVADTYSTNRNIVLNVAAPGVLGNDTDVEGSALTATKVTNPSHGSVTLNSDGSFTYTPTANYSGTDSFTYRANDGQANSNTVTVTITINAGNNAPVAVNDTYTTNEDTALNRAAPGVLSNDTDADGDNITAIKVSDPAHGTVTTEQLTVPSPIPRRPTITAPTLSPTGPMMVRLTPIRLPSRLPSTPVITRRWR